AYWRWDTLPPAGVPIEELWQAAHRTFTAAIQLRLGATRTAVASLSGGLDSRCVVAGLLAAGARVLTFNFAPPGSEDLVLGRSAAAALGTQHLEFPLGPTDFSDRMDAAYRKLLQNIVTDTRPGDLQRVWSGDGGSCVLGHIYINDTIVELMRGGLVAEAIDAYLALNQIGLPRKLFSRAVRDQITKYPRQGIREELERLALVDPGRRFHLFLLLNGQRRLHTRHYEDLDQRRFELVTPFFDAEFVALIAGSPIEPFLHHRFYNRWLQEFQHAVSTVPWQAYPGHEPCPLPKPPNLRSQWDNWYDDKSRAELLRQELALADDLVRSSRMPRQIINLPILRLARWLTRSRLGNYSHVFRCAAAFARYADGLRDAVP
ncbi:MAG: asparagine synthase C-terminal domain-containing protein, partial [Steroidobacteraceae bacterium]|nr:asparagine synthase C-terminal domain-containing protein [Steroidobacteraceae bacterium]MDW8259607.1 asparagine synthase C-terminal domain-containing protein [Gammaproteobacteria bacterium]